MNYKFRIINAVRTMAFILLLSLLFIPCLPDESNAQETIGGDTVTISTVFRTANIGSGVKGFIIRNNTGADIRMGVNKSYGVKDTVKCVTLPPGRSIFEDWSVDSMWFAGSGSGSVFIEAVFGSGKIQKVGDNNSIDDSLTVSDEIWQFGTVTERPILYQRYTDAGQPQTAFVGQVGVGEANWGLNLDYRQGLHNYFDSTRSQTYFTLNEDGFYWQRIPKGYANVTEQPDAWTSSGNTTPMRVDTSGFAGFIGGITSIFKTRGNPTIGTSTANDYTDTTKYNFYGRGGKSYVDNKFGIATDKPASTFHTVNKATTRATSNYGALSDWILQDDGASDRAQLEFRSPNGSAIFFGDQTTSNLAYIQYVNSTSTLNIVGTSIVNLAGTIQENGTALTSKYSQLVASNTYTGASNTFTNKVVVGTGTSNGTADFLAMGDTITLRGTVYRDSSYLRVEVNPFSQRLKISAIGKLGNNMFTIDSTLITSALAMTILGDFTTGGNIFAGSNNKQIGWNTRALMQSLSDGNILFTNWAGTTKATLSFGKFKMDLLPTYADNTAALAGGLVAGDGYKTSTGVVMITY